MAASLGDYHQQHPYLAGCARLTLRSRTKLPDGLLACALARLAEAGTVVEAPPGYALSVHSVELSEAAAEFTAGLLKLYADKAWTTPTREQAVEALVGADSELSEAAVADLFQKGT